MAKSVRQAWNYRKNTAPDGEDKELRKVAEDNIRERNETDLQTLLHLQGREVKSLEFRKNVDRQGTLARRPDDERQGTRLDQSAP